MFSCKGFAIVTSLSVLTVLATAGAARADSRVNSLFAEDFARAPQLLHYSRPLSDDSIYALTVTGATWQKCWGPNTLFYMGWLNGGTNRLTGRDVNARLKAVERALNDRDYQSIPSLTSGFTTAQISSNPTLKLADGLALLRTGNADAAFAVLAAPYHTIGRPDPELDFRLRKLAYQAAVQSGHSRFAVSLGLSLVLQPQPVTIPAVPRLPETVVSYLKEQGVDLERIALGILETPTGLRHMDYYTYAAADLICLKPTPDLLPVLFSMLHTGDTYLRARAIVALGSVDYRAARSGDDWTSNILPGNRTEYGLSADQQSSIQSTARDFLKDSNWRLRAAGCLALAFIGGSENHRLLETMVNDRAYVLSPPDRSGMRWLAFPVRVAADMALTRWGEHLTPGGGMVDRNDLAHETRNCSNVTGDTSGLRGTFASVIAVSPADAVLPRPQSPL
jgi:hypothetical protein